MADFYLKQEAQEPEEPEPINDKVLLDSKQGLSETKLRNYAIAQWGEMAKKRPK